MASISSLKKSPSRPASSLQARNCSLAVQNSGDPFNDKGGINLNSVVVKTPISYMEMFDGPEDSKPETRRKIKQNMNFYTEMRA